MELNLSSFYEGEESSSQLNSTALNQNSNQKEEKKEWKVSPIFNNRRKSFKSPLKVVNTTESGYESKSFSTPPPQEKTSDLSSFIANKSLNPFDSIIVNSLHKSINFSPRVVFSQEASSSKSAKDGDMFKWSVEHLAVLKPAHISEDEIAANYHSPIPEVEERIQEVLNEYWSKNVSYIPSPDGPRFVNIENRDGSVLTLKTGGSSGSSQVVHDLTPSLCKMIRKKEALKVAYATSSPKQRPRRQVKQMRNRNSQTDVTIPPSSDIDLKKILGQAFVHNPSDDEEDNEEVFNVSMCSNLSTRRRLFSATDQNGDENEEDDDDDEEAQNSSMVSCDNLDERFNDSLSPVRRDEQMDQDLSMVSKSHISQIAINISVLNDCMMHSLSQEEPEEEDEKEEEKKEEDEENGENHQVFHHNMHENEYSLHDESSATNATPRHEDLDWTPRRRLPAAFSPASCDNTQRHAQMRRFVYEMSPIHPSKRFTPPPPPPPSSSS